MRKTLLYPHYGAEYFLLRKLKEIAREVKGGILVDVGCGDRPYEHYFAPDKYIGIDIEGGAHPNSMKKVDLYYDGKTIPLANESIDWILCTEVLEHVNEPNDFIKECYRVLKTGGSIILSAPQCWGLHEEPYDFYRYTKYGLRYLFEKNNFKINRIESTTGIWGTIGQRLSSYIFYKFGRNKKLLKLIVSLFLCIPIQVVTILLDLINNYEGDTLDNIIFAKKNFYA